MVIFGALAIPVIGVIVLLIFFRKEVVWWEPVALLVIGIVMVSVFKLTVDSISISDTEYWGGYVTDVTNYEPWDEQVPCRHPEYIYVPDGDGGTKRVYVGDEHPYDVDQHPAEYYIDGSNGEHIAISSDKYQQVARLFENKTFIELNRSYYSQDGDEYICKWPGSAQTIIPIVTEHSYTNKVQASPEFDFPKVDKATKEKYGLFDYPKVQDGYAPSILGAGGPTMQAGQVKFDRLNALLGRSKQIRVFVLVFKNQPIEAAKQQANLWKGGNKNELILCIGVDNANQVKWREVISWTEAPGFKSGVKEATYMNTLDLPTLADRLEPLIKERWVRKEFKDFNYLTVKPPLWGVILTYLVMLFGTIGFCWWTVNNEYETTE